MGTRVPKTGDIVLYELTDGDAQAINRRRADARDSLELHKHVKSGAIVHTGNSATGGITEWADGSATIVSRGDIYPMIITRTWGATTEASVNGQVWLDGNDTIWVTSVSESDQPRGFQYRPSRLSKL